MTPGYSLDNFYCWTFGTWNISFQDPETLLRVYEPITQSEYRFDTAEAGAEKIHGIMSGLEPLSRRKGLENALQRTTNLRSEVHGALVMRVLIRRILATVDSDTKAEIFKDVLKPYLSSPSRGGGAFIELFGLMCEFLTPDQQIMVCSNYPNLLMNIVSNHTEEERGYIHKEPQELSAFLKMMSGWYPKAALRMFLYNTPDWLNTAYVLRPSIDVLTSAAKYHPLKIPLLVQFIQSLPHEEQLSIYNNQSGRIRRPHYFVQKCDYSFSSSNLSNQAFYEAEMHWLLKELQDKIDETGTERANHDAVYNKLDETLGILQTSFTTYQNSGKEQEDVAVLKETWSAAIQGARESASADYPPIWDILTKALLAVTLLGAVYLACKAVSNYKQNRSLFFPSHTEQKYHIQSSQYRSDLRRSQ